ncbi:MAG TPA: hypothetical protein VFK05_18750 [Polyangiaceae bacterium]|nr:hypothetical protein [Polyangiaceae bacterium]
MSDRRSSSDLGSSAEATLGSFPFPERDWESDARAIEARVADSAHGSTDSALLAAPLPSEAGEPSMASATATPLTNSGVRTQSLTELARRSVERKQAAERQMARESLALAAQRRQRSADNDEPPPPVSVNGAAANHVAVKSVAANHVVAPEAASTVNHWPKLALGLPVLALAAAVLLWFRRPEPGALVTGPVASPTPSATTVGASTLAQQPASAAVEAPRGIDPSTLPGEPSGAPDSALAKGTPVSGSAALASASKVGISKGVASERGTSGPKVSDPGLPPDPTLRPADSLGGELPAKPTTGAVQAALGAVLSGARHCVAGDDAPSSAVVVFGSDGRVQQVTVSGPAAGKSSASCIEAQLRRARVQPFASSSFSVNATVRPE